MSSNTRFKAILTAVLSTILAGTLSADPNTYEFLADLSHVTRFDAAAAECETYDIDAQFQLSIDDANGTASFDSVSGIYGNTIFDLTNLTGTVIDDTEILFEGQTGSTCVNQITITVRFAHNSAILTGGRYPDPLCDDSTTYMLDAVAWDITGGGVTTPVTRLVPGEYSTIQKAIVAANDGDTVQVADGSYWEYGIDFLGKAITVTSENGPENCTILGGSSLVCRVYDYSTADCGFHFQNAEDADSILEGFTIGGSSAVGLDDSAILCEQASPTIIDCRLIGNSSGITLLDSDSTLEDCIISGNSTQGNGGGIRCVDGEIVVSNCIIESNIAKGDIGGGGIYTLRSIAQFTNCLIAGNGTTFAGGGINTVNSELVLTNCTITDNIALADGGGLNCVASDVFVDNSIFWRNQAAEAGQQIAAFTGFVVVDIGPDVPLLHSIVTVSNSNIQKGQGDIYVDPMAGNPTQLDWGHGNIATYPGFVQPGHWLDDDWDEAFDSSSWYSYLQDTWNPGDYNLLEGSACIDAGNNNLIMSFDTDIAGHDRIINQTVDIGAYEYQYGAFLPDVYVPLSVSRLRVRAGRTIESDEFTISGTFPSSHCAADCLWASFNAADSMYVRVGPYAESLEIDDSWDIGRRVKYRNKTGQGGITKMTLDLTKGKFSFSGQDIPLTGLAEPVLVELVFGDYYAFFEDAVDRDIPIQFMDSHADTLRISKAKLRQKATPNKDSLTISGAIAREDTSIDLTDNNLVIGLANQTFTVLASDIVTRKQDQFTCRKADVIEGGEASVDINFTKRTFSISLKKADIVLQSTDTTFTLSSGTFSAAAPVSLD